MALSEAFKVFCFPELYKTSPGSNLIPTQENQLPCLESSRTKASTMPISRPQSDLRNKSTGSKHLDIDPCHELEFPRKSQGAVLLHHSASRFHFCLNLWRAGISDFPSPKSRNCKVTQMGECLEN